MSPQNTMSTSEMSTRTAIEGEPLNARDQYIEQAVQLRGEQWQQAIESELQDLVKQASGLRGQINNSKTGTKKRYYEKKFAKVSTQVRQMVSALQRVQANTAASTQIPSNASDTNTI